LKKLQKVTVILMSNRKTTRNANGSGTIRKRADGKWEARYSLGRDSGTGKQIQKSVYGKTQAEVRKKLSQIITTIDEGSYTEPSKYTLGIWLDEWLNTFVKPTVKISTFRTYEQRVRVNIKPKLAAIRLTELSTPTIQKMYNEMSASGLSAKSVKVAHGVLHKALEQAVALGYLRVNPSDACKLPRMVKKEIKPLDDLQIAEFMEAIRGHKYETLYLVSLFSGMRQSETLALKLDCIDFKAGTILISRQVQKENTKGGEYYLSTVKNDKARRITPALFIMKALRAHKVKQLELRLKTGQAWVDENFVFTNEVGEHLKHVTVYKNYKRIVESIGIPSARFHDLRHSYAVAALQSGDDVKTVQENLGHHTAAFTLDAYGHVTEKMKRDSAARMDAYIRSVKTY
jgi:integrase